MLDAIELQVVAGALASACREMGAVLIRSAHSSNIKERRDASTALFDADVITAITPRASVEKKRTPQSTAPDAVAAALSETRDWIRRI